MDAVLSAVMRDVCLLDAVDEEWIRDALSDDEIEVPPEHAVAADDVEALAGGRMGEEEEREGKEEDRWHELGLEELAADAADEAGRPSTPPPQDAQRQH